MSKRLPPQAFGGIEYVRRYYGVSAKQGGRVRYTSFDGAEHLGTITGARGPHLRIRFDGDKFALLVHPTDVEYLEATA